METLSSKQKKRILRDFFILSYKLGYSIEEYMGKTFSYFDFDGVFTAINKMNEENIQDNDSYYFMYAPIYQSSFTTILKTEY